MQSGTNIDLVWVNQREDVLLVACLVDTNNKLNYHSDHQASVTAIRRNHDNVATSVKNHTSESNWNIVDHKKSLTKLRALLTPLTHQPRKTVITILDPQILEAVTASLNKASPSKLKTHPHKGWWNPKTMVSLKKKAKRARD